MPHQARINAPGALHHIVIRGIECKAIFKDDQDREDLLERLSRWLQEMDASSYARAMIINHVLASGERMLGSSEFVETALKHSGEMYDRRMQLQSAGIDLTALIAAVCRWLDIDDKELAGPTKRLEIARARALLSCTATRNLSISGREVSRRLNVDSPAIRRAAQRVSRDPDLMATTKTILELLKLEISQQ